MKSILHLFFPSDHELRNQSHTFIAFFWNEGQKMAHLPDYLQSQTQGEEKWAGTTENEGWKVIKRANFCDNIQLGGWLKSDSLSGCFSFGVMERMKSWGVM